LQQLFLEERGDFIMLLTGSKKESTLDFYLFIVFSVISDSHDILN